MPCPARVRARLLLSASAVCFGLALAPCRAAAQQADTPVCGARWPVTVRDDAADALESYVVTPQSARTGAGDDVRLTLASSDPRAPICRVSGWSVNGVPGGDPSVGIVHGTGLTVAYLAPAQVGENGLKVTVTATVETPPALGVRQVQLMADIEVAAERRSTCLPLDKGQTGGDFGCHYWALGLPREIPGTGDGPRVFVDKIRLSIEEDAANRPYEWRIAAWTHAEGARISEQSDMNPFGTLEETAPGLFRMIDSDGNPTSLELHTRDGGVVLDMFNPDAPMIFELARDPRDFPKVEDPKAHAVEGPLREYLQQQEQEAFRRKMILEQMERMIRERVADRQTPSEDDVDPKLRGFSEMVRQWVADHPPGPTD
ncbi:hypothetical protein [Caulobacter sp. 17J65-9]|uniref:hypothetical protein n=1 Tax=Caulobacter sp. 17J65-9 TaxID=2709382 RepID=UPI0013C95CB1|nr:hypothetical protein [Caulobacter sp. 17J65-9]NEX93678.1 hypothetical protein [Caulobacter sp. 17J65-9]